MSDPDKEHDAIRHQCWEAALHAYGTSYVFGRRARGLRRKLQWLTFVSLGVPFLIGALVLAYGQLKLLALVIAVGAAVGVVQALVALWSVVGGWVDNYSFAAQSSSANETLATRFSDLGRNPPVVIEDLRHRFDVLTTEDQSRRDQDHPKDVTDAERRMGMRAALRRLQKPCAGCGKVPASMEATDCDVCGRFKYRAV